MGSGYSNGYHYYHQNEHGDIEYITGKDGKVENAYTYDAFGNITSSTELVKNRYTYNGEQYDQVTQQYYLRARYYNPLVGRFTQEDVYRGDGLNLYAYCGSNPVMYVDPSGYEEKVGKEVCGEYYEELKQRFNENPEWNADPDKFRVVQGDELAAKRKEYDSMVKNGELPAGHHIQGLADGGENVKENIKVTGEKFIDRNSVPEIVSQYYDENYASKRNKHPQKLAIYEENGVVKFGKNPNHTDVTNMQNNLHRSQRNEGLRLKNSKVKKKQCE